MGLESFFILVLPEGIIEINDKLGIRKYVGNSSISVDSMNLFLQNTAGFASGVYKRIVSVNITSHDQLHVQNILLECCFFHYMEGISAIKQFWRLLREKFLLDLYHPGVGANSSEIDVFEEKVKEFYRDKYEAFISEFGADSGGEIVLPNKGFMQYLERKGKLF